MKIEAGLMIRSRRRLAPLVVVAAVALGAASCGGGGADGTPAHSPSFFPVRGTNATGGPVAELHWIYRINGGQAAMVVPGNEARYDDEDVTIVGGTVQTTTLRATTTSTIGASETISTETIDHLSSSSPATVTEREGRVETSTSDNGMTTTSSSDIHVQFAPTPLPVPFDRTDLDTLAAGFSETVPAVQASGTGTARTTTNGVTQTEPVSLDATLTQSWTLLEVMQTFRVLGRDYGDVVRVRLDVAETDVTGASIAQVTSTYWLAKGIGLIRKEDLPLVAGAATIVSELVATNLVGP